MMCIGYETGPEALGRLVEKHMLATRVTVVPMKFMLWLFSAFVFALLDSGWLVVSNIDREAWHFVVGILLAVL